VHLSRTNYLARVQEVKSFLCPSDAETMRKPQQGLTPTGVAAPGENMGRNNHVGNIGSTADMRSTVMTRVGIFNYQLGAGNTVAGFPVISRVRVADVTDGTSNTCMMSETRRSTVAGGCFNGNSGDTYNLTNVYLLNATDPGWSVDQPDFGPTNGPEQG